MSDAVAVPAATTAKAVAVLEGAVALPVPGRGCPSKAACPSDCWGQDGRRRDATIKWAQKAFERQPHGAVCLQMLFLAALLDLIIKLSIAIPVPLRHLHMEYYSGAFPDASKPSCRLNWKKPKMFAQG